MVALAGAGGMGEVWRARDPRLGRDVAIKAIPDAFASDPERLARFEREARLLASLRHPNIAAIHGLEEGEGHRYLVLEYVEGDTLAVRLERGPLPLTEALDTCRQIAAALESAHESGVIHRDLKPGNVKLTPAGEVKVLDFGLAKGPEAGSSSTGGPALTQSPTLTAAMTGIGVVLGTAAYMSPEQARGKPVDRRTDIWSFGCVLFECLTGRQAFEGETVTDLIARILEREPDLALLPASVPAPIRELLRRCFEKDARQRLRDIGEARLELERALAALTTRRSAAPAERAPDVRRPPGWAWFVAGAALAALATWLAFGRGGPRGGAAAPFSHVDLAMPDDVLVYETIAIPDGSGLVVVGTPRAERTAGEAAVRLYLRAHDRHDLKELPGTRGLRDAAVSPDGRWILLVAPIAPGSPRARLYRIPVDGSAPPVVVTDWQDVWQSFVPMKDGGVLVLDEPATRMWTLPAGGGTPVERKVERGAFRGRADLGRMLPGDRAALVNLVAYRERGFGYQVAALEPKTGRLTTIVEDGGRARYAASGHLVFARGEVLLAARFDLRTLRLRGTPVAVASGLRTEYEYLPGGFELLPDGTLLYAPGGTLGNRRRFGIADRSGRITPLSFEPRTLAGWLTAAHDANTFVFRITNALGYDDIWTGTLRPATARRLVAFPTADCVSCVISPDGRQVAYTRVGHDAEDGVYVTLVASGGPGFRVVAPESTGVRYRASSWTPDGSALIMTRISEGPLELYVARLTAARDSAASVARWRLTGASDAWASVSRDGRWVAFESDQSGSREILVAPLGPDLRIGAPFRVSGEGGGQGPEWLLGSRVLFYRSSDFSTGTVVDFGGVPHAGGDVKRETLDLESLRIMDQTVLHDGRFLAVLRDPAERFDLPSVRVIAGWTRDLDRKIAGQAR